MLFPVLAVFLVAGAAQSSLTGDQACQFVGSRFVRVESECDLGFCSDISRLLSGAFVSSKGVGAPLACSEAIAEVSTFLESHGGHAGPLQSPDIYIGLLEHILVPLMENLALGMERPSSSQDSGLATLDADLLRAAAENPVPWFQESAPRILASGVMQRVAVLYDRVAREALDGSITFSSLRSAFQAVVQFYFDLAASLGGHFASPVFFKSVPAVLHGSGPLYRPSDRRELFFVFPWTGVPETSGDLLLASGAISNLAESDGELEVEDVLAVHMLLSGWERSLPSAAKSLLRDQIESALCPRMDSLVRRAEYITGFLVSQFLTAVLSTCRPVVSMTARRRFRDSLAIWFQRRASRLSHRSRSELPANLGLMIQDADIYESRVQVAEASMWSLIASTVDFIDKGGGRQVFVFSDNDERTMRRFGQSMGMAILYGIDLKSLRLCPEIVRMLNPRFRRHLGPPSRVAAAIDPTPTDVLMHVSIGVGERLGLAGFELFELDDWLKIFGVPL